MDTLNHFSIENSVSLTIENLYMQYISKVQVNLPNIVLGVI